MTSQIAEHWMTVDEQHEAFRMLNDHPEILESLRALQTVLPLIVGWAARDVELLSKRQPELSHTAIDQYAECQIRRYYRAFVGGE